MYYNKKKFVEMIKIKIIFIIKFYNNKGVKRYFKNIFRIFMLIIELWLFIIKKIIFLVLRKYNVGNWFKWY